MRHGPLYLIAAALLWSLSGAFVKSPVLQALPQGTSGITIAFYRALFAGLVPPQVVLWGWWENLPWKLLRHSFVR